MRRQPILVRLAVVSLVIGAFALVRNLLSTWQTLQEYPNASFLNVFLSTASPSGGTDLVFVFFVWGPLVFGGLGVALLVLHFVTRAAGVAAVGGAAATTAHAWAQPQQPQSAGWQPEQPNPIQPLGGSQPPPPDASDRIQP